MSIILYLLSSEKKDADELKNLLIVYEVLD